MEQIERGIGDNRVVLPHIRVSVKAFNSLAPFLGGCAPVEAEFPAGATVADVVQRFGVPPALVYLVLVNGRDITKGLGCLVNLDRELEHGDAVMLSGPVPYSWGYGAPVV